LIVLKSKYFSNRAGEYIEWSGDKFVRIPMQRNIAEYKDLKEIDSLPVKLLDDRMKQVLKHRGEKYIGFAG
jgi:hypothetical protein